MKYLFLLALSLISFNSFAMSKRVDYYNGAQVYINGETKPGGDYYIELTDSWEQVAGTSIFDIRQKAIRIGNNILPALMLELTSLYPNKSSVCGKFGYSTRDKVVRIHAMYCLQVEDDNTYGQYCGQSSNYVEYNCKLN